MLEMTFSRLASLVVAAGFVIAALFLFGGGGNQMVHCALAVLVPLPFIWFPEAFASYTGPANWGYATRPTPAVFLAVAGWILLVVGPLVLLTLGR
jgi:hypothetical protein